MQFKWCLAGESIVAWYCLLAESIQIDIVDNKKEFFTSMAYHLDDWLDNMQNLEVLLNNN